MITSIKRPELLEVKKQLLNLKREELAQVEADRLALIREIEALRVAVGEPDRALEEHKKWLQEIDNEEMTGWHS